MASWMGMIYPEDEAAQQAPHLSSNSESDYSRSGSDDSYADDVTRNSDGRVINAASNRLRKEVINRTASDEDSTYSMSDVSGGMDKKPKNGAGGWPSRKIEKYFSLNQGFKYGTKNVPTPPSSDYSSQEESPVSTEVKAWVTDKREIQASEDINKFMTSNQNKNDSIVEYCSSEDDRSGGVPSMNESSSVSTLSARSVERGMDDSGTDVKAELQNLKSKLNNLGFKGPNAKKKKKTKNIVSRRTKDDKGHGKKKKFETVHEQDAPTVEDASQVSSVMLNPKASEKEAEQMAKSSEQGGFFSNSTTDCCFVGGLPLASLLTGTIDEDQAIDDADVPPIRHVTFSTKTPEVFDACADPEFSCTPTIETESIQNASVVMLSYINGGAPNAKREGRDHKKVSSAQNISSTPQVDVAAADKLGKALPLVHAPSEEIRADKEGRQLKHRSQSKSTNGEDKNSTVTQTLVETIKTGGMNLTSSCDPEISSPIDEVFAEHLDDGSIVVSLITTEFPHGAHPGYSAEATPPADTARVPEFIGASLASKDSLDGFLAQNYEVCNANKQRTPSGVSGTSMLSGDLNDEQPPTAIKMSTPSTANDDQSNEENAVPSDTNDLESGGMVSSGGNGNIGEVSRGADMGESNQSAENGDAEQEEVLPEEPQLEMVILPGDDFGSTSKQDVHDDTAARREVSRRLCIRLSVLGLLFVILLSLLIVFLRKGDDKSTSMVIESSATTSPNVVVFTEPPMETEIAETGAPVVDATEVPFAEAATAVPTESATCTNRVGTDGFCYNVFSPLFVFFDNCDPLPDDWLGIYPAGSDPMNLPEPDFWVWTCGNQDCFAEIFSDAYTLNFNMAPGFYMVYLARQGNGFPPYQAYANSEEFIVVEEGVDCQQLN